MKCCGGGVVQRNEEQQFLFETTVTASVADTVAAVAGVHELTLRLVELAHHGEELAKYGPSKPPGEEGLDAVLVGGATISGEPEAPHGPTYEPDPTGKRTGEAPVASAAETLRTAVADGAALVSKAQVAKRVPLTSEALSSQLDVIRGAVMICFPMGLPPHDPVRINLEGSDGVVGKGPNAAIDPASAQLWFSGKQMQRGNALSDHVGKHEKTKVIVRFSAAGAGPPARENPTDAETQKNMMAFYHKRQAEVKALEENDEDDHANSAWANPKSLKTHFSGVGNIRFR